MLAPLWLHHECWHRRGRTMTCTTHIAGSWSQVHHLDRQQDGSDAVGCGPVLLQDVQADVACVVHIGVEARRVEAHQRRLEWVVLQARMLRLRALMWL